MTKPAQLDREIAEALARGPSASGKQLAVWEQIGRTISS